MKILLDECLNWRLKKEILSHEVFTVQDMGWSGIVNGELMKRASEAGFTIFVTIDKKLPFQQNVKKFPLAIVVLQTRFNRLEFIRPLIPKFLEQLSSYKSGEVYEL